MNERRNILEAYTNSEKKALIDNPLVFDNIAFHSGCGIRFQGGNSTVTLKSPGVYQIMLNSDLAFDADAAVIPGDPVFPKGEVSLQLYKNGVIVPYAGASALTAGIKEPINLAFSAIVEVKPSCCAIDNTSYIQIVNAGEPIIYTRANLVITKIG